MSVSDEQQPGLRERISAQGEEAVGKLAQSLLENPAFNNALQAAFGAREKAVQAQKSAMGALNLPSATDIERLTRRVRSVSDRLESLEDAMDKLDESMARGAGPDRLERIESRLDELIRDVATLRKQLASGEQVSNDQERMKVTEA